MGKAFIWCLGEGESNTAFGDGVPSSAELWSHPLHRCHIAPTVTKADGRIPIDFHWVCSLSTFP